MKHHENEQTIDFAGADAAALAGAAEVDVALYRLGGQLVLTDNASAMAQTYGGMASSYLTSRRIYPYVTGIWVDPAARTVRVTMAARTEDLIPLLGQLLLRGEGEAEIRVAAP